MLKSTHTFSAQEMSFTERLVKNANKAKVWGNPIDDYCFVYENGTMDFTFEIYTNPERKVKHVFKGKKLDTNGINSLSAKHDKDVIYNLHGHRIQGAQKGLYIVNGKKVLLNNK